MSEIETEKQPWNTLFRNGDSPADTVPPVGGMAPALAPLPAPPVGPAGPKQRRRRPRVNVGQLTLVGLVIILLIVVAGLSVQVQKLGTQLTATRTSTHQYATRAQLNRLRTTVRRDQANQAAQDERFADSGVCHTSDTDDTTGAMISYATAVPVINPNGTVGCPAGFAYLTTVPGS